jgi:hypothetical protein
LSTRPQLLTASPRRATAVGLLLALAITAPAFAGSLALAIHLSLSPFVLAVALAVSVTWLAPRLGTRREAAAACAIAVAIVAVSLFASSFVFDLSFDGQTYHQTAVRALAGGWNPVWNPRTAESFTNALHVGSLPKAAWVLEAMIFQSTGSLESAKGVQLVALTAAFLLAWTAFENIGTRPRAARLLALFCAASPVAISQLPTFYVDGLVASSVVMLLALVVLYVRTTSAAYAVALVFVASFLANVKFTGLVYAALIGIGTLASIAMFDRTRLRPALALMAAAAALATVQGVNPYITNTVLHGNPAYPGARIGAVPLAHVVYRDSAFAEQAAPVQLARSIFSESSDDDARAPRLKIPFTIHAGELGAFTTVDARTGGWGPLFGGALIIACGLLAAAVVRGDRRARALSALSACIVLSALAVPVGAYARYAPQLWLACIPALLIDDVRSWRTQLLAAAVGLNLVFVGSVSLGAQLFIDHLHRQQLRTLAALSRGDTLAYAQSNEPFANVDLHFRAYAIRAAERTALHCEAPARLLKTHVDLCLPGDRSPPPPPDPLAVVAPLLSRVGLGGIAR